MEGLGKTLTNLIFVAVDVGGINVLVANLQGVRHGLLDLTRSRLPCSQTFGDSQFNNFKLANNKRHKQHIPMAGILAPVLRVN